MAIIKCEYCGQDISDISPKCIHCGCDVIKKIECKECGKYTIGKDNVCEFCGAPINLEQKKEKKLIKKKIIIIFVTIFISVLSVVLFLIFKDSKETRKEYDYEALYETLLGVSVETEILVDDLYNSWHYGIYEDGHNKYDLSYEVSLNSSDLNNSYCTYLILDKFEYPIYCVRQAHKDLGHFDDVNEKLDKVKQELEKLRDNNNEKVQALNDLYLDLKAYFDIAENYTSSFLSLQNVKTDKRSKVDDSINKLDLLLNYDSKDFMDAYEEFEQKSNSL